eukprot:s80_g6.t1
MEALRKQHLDWESAVKSMLQHICVTLSEAVEKSEPVFTEDVEKSEPVELKRGNSTVSQRSSRFAGALELQKLRNSRIGTANSATAAFKAAQKDSTIPEVMAIASSSPTGATAREGMRRVRTRSSENSRMLEEILSHPTGSQSSRSNRIQGVLAWIVESTVFECLTGFVILLNLILIGAEAEMKVTGQVTAWAEHIEHFFLAVYTIELLMRFAVGSWPLFRSGWFLLDFFLVCLGLLALVVIPSIETGAQEGFEQVFGSREVQNSEVKREDASFVSQGGGNESFGRSEVSTPAPPLFSQEQLQQMAALQNQAPWLYAQPQSVFTPFATRPAFLSQEEGRFARDVQDQERDRLLESLKEQQLRDQRERDEMRGLLEKLAKENIALKATVQSLRTSAEGGEPKFSTPDEAADPQKDAADPRGSKVKPQSFKEAADHRCRPPFRPRSFKGGCRPPEGSCELFHWDAERR